jgi:hypothetical protein
MARIPSIAALLFALAPSNLFAQPAPAPEREVVAGITTRRTIPGMPYELAGKRVVFANWYYIQPGDLDWRDADGKSVYVSGNSAPFEAHHIGVNAPRGIRLVAQKPQVIGPLDLPSRGVLQDGNIYKGWTSTHYLESTNGMHWEPKAALVGKGPVTGSTWHVFVDPSAPAAERYKAVWTTEITRAEFEEFRKKRPDGWEPRALYLLGEKDQVACVRGAVSPDGIQWTGLPEPLVVECSDTHNICYYDAALRKYVLYTRFWSVGPRSTRLPADIRNSWTGVGRRAIGRSESSDFRSFPPSELLLEPTSDMLPSETLYTNCRTSIPGAPDQHLMFPAIWNASIDDTTRIGLVSSHDGRIWHWVPGGELVSTAPFGQWNGGCVWAYPELLELPNGDWALMIRGDNFPHKYPRGQRQIKFGYALWPKGRLVGLEAAEEGAFTMMPLIAPDRRLKINALTLRTGWVKVEVVGVDNRKMADCVPIVGDQHWAQVTWKSGHDLGVAEGQPLTLRFELRQAKLFGLEMD